jgi:serine/threonine protein kinase/Tol biopolymer transport system component
MPLAVGTRLGPYEILSPIGAGGMGEVYRARDTRLQRDVAIKVLPERLAENEQALARFEREARVVAALSHPNILAIHDVGRDGTTAYAVMELLEGATLRDELRGGPLPARQATTYAAQSAEGLAAAHDKGVVHRDLKPENLFVTRDGRLKVLDFGLAREERASSGSRGESESPTLARETDPGVVVGTVGYMSPEQVRGDAVDHRSDIFSLGCVLQEMLTGRRAFERATAAETMTAILREDPASLSDTGRALPPALERIVGHCLEKKPDQRFQSARDLAFDLASVSGASATASPPTPPPRFAKAARWIAAASGAALLLGLGYRAGRATAGRATAAPQAHFTQITDLPGAESSPSLSRDGKTLAFVARVGGHADVYVQRVGGHNPINLTADCPKDDTGPSFSPDGERIAFHSDCEGGGLFVMGATGESRRRVASFGYDPAWSPDGRSIVVASEPTLNPLSRNAESKLSIVDLASGSERLLLDDDAMQPAWSPDGRRIAFWNLRGGPGGTGRRDLWTVAPSGGPAVEVTNDEDVDWSPAWSPDSRYLYFSSGRGGTLNLWRVAIDTASGRRTGAFEPVTTPSRSSGSLSLSGDGSRLAFEAREERSALYRADFDPASGRAGTPTLVLGGSRAIFSLGLSPDGQWIAWASAGLRENLFVVRMDGTGYRQLTDDSFRNRGPSWSSDGSQICFYSNRSGRYEIWSIHADGSNLVQLTSTDAGSRWFPEWAPDGSRLSVAGIPTTRLIDPARPAGQQEVLALPALADGSSFQVVSWSADSSRLAGMGMRPDGTSAGIFLYSIASGGYQRVATGGRTPNMLADGRHLVYDDDGTLRFLDTQSGRSTEVLTVGPPSMTVNQRQFRITRDNRHIVFLRNEAQADIWLMSPE